MKPLKRKTQFGRPLKYPDLIAVAKELAIKDKSFDQKAWTLTETQRKLILHGRYFLKKKDGTLKEWVPFMLLIPKFNMEPKKNVLVMFNKTNHLRYITYKYEIRERIKGIYFEIINE